MINQSKKIGKWILIKEVDRLACCEIFSIQLRLSPRSKSYMITEAFLLQMLTVLLFLLWSNEFDDFKGF